MSAAANRIKSVQISKYTGQLAEPIYEPTSSGVHPHGRKREAEIQASIRQAKKMGRLMNWYKIDPDSGDCWYSLAWALAIAHVPGLRVIHAFKPSRGRKPSWKAGLAVELLRDVEALRAQKRISISAAIRILCEDKNSPWRKFTEGNLVTRHREARKIERQRSSWSGPA